MKTAFIWIFLVSSFLFTSHFYIAEATPYKHPETGLVFEETMGGLNKGNFRNFEEKYPGLGVSIGYNASGITVTVYIYNLGMESIDDNLESPSFKRHFKEVIRDIFAAEKAGHYKDVTLLQIRAIDLGPKKTCPRALAASLSYTQGEINRLSKVYLLVYKQQFLKIRFTHDENANAQAEAALPAFLNQIGGQLKCD